MCLDYFHIARSNQNVLSLSSRHQRLISEVEQNEVIPALGYDQAFWKLGQGDNASLVSQMSHERFGLYIIWIPTQVKSLTSPNLVLN